MNDQAENLRKAIERLKGQAVVSGAVSGAVSGVASASGVSSGAVSGAYAPGAQGAPLQDASALASELAAARKGPPRVLAVTSGKGGVGKTNVSVNLAVAFRELGLRVVILDADFGLSNVEVLFGVIPRYKLLDMAQNGRTAEEVITDGPAGVKFISGGSGLEEIARLEQDKIAELLASLSEVDESFDIILIDTGAGLSETVLNMSLAADEVIVVATPEPTSVTDAYAMIKTLSQRDREKPIRLLVNRVDNAREAEDIHAKLSRVSGKFLDLKLEKLGYIVNDALVSRSVKAQQPFLIGYPKSHPAQCVRDVARALVALPGGGAEGGAGGDMNAVGARRGLSGFVSGISRMLNIQFK